MAHESMPRWYLRDVEARGEHDERQTVSVKAVSDSCRRTFDALRGSVVERTPMVLLKEDTFARLQAERDAWSEEAGCRGLEVARLRAEVERLKADGYRVPIHGREA